MSVVGFDIGTTFSKVAVVHQKKITIVPNDLSKLTTPTLMAFTDNERLFGEAAVSQWARNYKCTIPQIKRLIGRQADDPSLQQELQDYFLINTAPLENGRIGIEVDTSEGHATIAPEQALAPYLSKLKEFTSQYLENLPIRDCVITCPNYFDDAQRRALLTAAKLADLNVLRLMNESTAIALNYGLLRELPKEPSRVIFCDVGESNTQVSVVDFVPGKLTMRYVAVDPFVGGRNFDLALFKYFSNLWQKQNSTPIHGSKRATLRLMRECNNVKKILSANRDCILPLDCFLDDVDFTLKIDRETAEKEWEPILQNILKPLQEAIEVTKNDNIKITSVEMVGGASRIPSVQEKFVQYIKSIAPDIQSLSWTLNGDETVARGAALMCAMESPVMKVKEFQIQEINTWPVAIEYASDKDKDSNIEQLIIDRLNPLPCTAKLTFHKTQSFEFKLKLPSKVQVNENTVMNISFPFSTQRSIGTFSIASIPLSENLIGDPKIKLCISLNKHGIVDWPQGTLLETIKRVKPPANEQKTQMSPSDIKINGTSIPTPTTDRMDVDPQQQQQQQQDQKLDQKQQCQEQLVQEQQPQEQQQQQQQQSQPQNQKEPMDTDASEENGNEVTNKNENGDENRENKENSNTGNQIKDGATSNIDSKDDTKEHVETNDDPNTDNQNISNPKLEEKKSDKKKIQRNLQITGKFENVIPIETFNKWFDFEAALSLKDKVVRETLERRNELETYIYTTRNKLDSEYKGYVNEVERDNLIKKLTENEEWLYGEGENANRSSYVERLKNLRSLSDLIDSRYQEGTTRPKYIEKLKKLIGQYQSFANETDNPLYDHITQEEKNQVKDYATKCDEWLTEKIIQQERIPLYEKPTLLTKEIDDKYRELMNQCRPIVTKPKPEPPKEEKKENVDGNANGNPNSNTDTNINGHTDLNTNAQDTTPSQKQESSNSSTDPQFEQKEQPQQQSQTNKDNTGAEKDPMDIEC